MIQPIPKPVSGAKLNRGSYAYKKQKAQFLSKYAEHNGMWVCWHCRRWFADIELDHIDNTGMGGSPTRLMDINNWQLLCRECHSKKHGV